MIATPIELPMDAIADLCRRYRVRELSLFGSASRGESRPDSDVDFLVDFDPGAAVGLIGLFKMQSELSELHRRPVDLVPKGGLRPILRREVLAGARVVYEAR